MTITTYPEGSIFSKTTPGKNGIPNSTAIIFIHAAIADNTLWDAQISFLTQKGITCIQYDMLGFGSSLPSQDYLKSDPRPGIDHMKHISDLIAGLKSDGAHAATKIVIAGLSMGGGLALRFATMYPEKISGLIVIASFVPGYDPQCEWPKEEQEQDEAIEAAIAAGELEKAARLQVRYWGDGPLQREGRCVVEVRERLYGWCLDVARRRYENTGGSSLPSASKEVVVSKEMLAGLKMPVAVALGRFDEVWTNAAMEFLATAVGGGELRRFDSAHMVNLECEGEFNEWVFGWVEKSVM